MRGMASKPHWRDHLKRAVTAMGGPALAARACGITPSLMHYYLRDANKLSGEMAIKISRASAGLVTKAQLRPDLFI